MDAHTRWAVDQMQRYLREGNPAAVVEIGEHVIAHEDDDFEVIVRTGFCLGLGYEHLRQWDRALHWFEQCLALDPGNPLLSAARARVCMKMGRVGEAARLFRDLAAQNPDRADYHQAAGAALLRQGERKVALQHLVTARRLDPVNPYVLHDLGQAYVLDGEFESALEAFKQATAALAPGDHELVRRIRESIEEVRAALLLRQRATQPLESARVSDLGPAEASPAATIPRAEADESEAAQFYARSRVRAAVVDAMIEHSCRPRQVFAALHLWSDFLDALSTTQRERTDQHVASWTPAVLYTIGRLDGEPWARQEHLAERFGVSPAAISRGFGRLRRTLAIEIGDPRYCTRDSARRDMIIRQIRRGRIDTARLLL